MKMNALVHASINQLSLIDFRIESCSVPANHQYSMPSSPIERFVYIVKGKTIFHLDCAEFVAHEKDMVYLSKETAYRSQWQEDSEFMVIDLILHDIDGQEICFNDKPGVIFHDTHGAYRGLLENLAEIAKACGPFDWLERLSLSFKLLCEIARDTNRSEMDEQLRTIKPGLTFLENNFTSEFYVGDLAKMCCISTSRFRQIFAERMGISPVEYRNRLRIEKAVALLKKGENSISEIAELVGISDVKYFTKLFKQHIGTTPKALKNN